MIPVVLSGGAGTRLWPVSRVKLPKQFCSIFEQNLQTMTLLRLTKLGPPWVVTAQNLRDLTTKNLLDLNLNLKNLILEPEAKNTAPAIALLTSHFLKLGLQNSIVGIFPADHIIENEQTFLSAVHLAQVEAQMGKIATLGVKPETPNTGYGYIQISKKSLSHYDHLTSHTVLKFHEKPSRDKAESFLKEGNFYWNAGIFIFKVQTMAELLKVYQPQLWMQISAINTDFSNLGEVYKNIEEISIDHALMEKLSPELLACIPCDMGWNDIGSWDAISEVMDSSGVDNKIEVDAKNNFVHTSNKKMYTFISVDDLIVVDTSDALLISKKGTTQKVKNIVDLLRQKNSNLLTEHTFEDRPWGRFEILKDSDKFKSKVIRINPSQQISYQSHAKREEHWLITQGEGEVILNDDIIPVKSGSYVKIPQGAKHRIRNLTSAHLEFVEVQLGTYFGEDDIVRYHDDYSRL